LSRVAFTVWYVAMSLADVATTVYGMSIGHVEQNTVANALISNFGVIEGAILHKSLFAGILLALVLPRWERRGVRFCAYGAGIATTAIAIANILTIGGIIQ